MLRKRGAPKGKMILALASVFVLLVSFMQPVAAMAAEEAFILRLREQITSSSFAPVAPGDTETLKIADIAAGPTMRMAQVVDANVCAVLLGNNLIDVNGNVTVDAGTLTTALANLLLTGQLSLGSIGSVDAFVGVLLNGGCTTPPAPPPPPPPPVTNPIDVTDVADGTDLVDSTDVTDVIDATDLTAPTDTTDGTGTADGTGTTDTADAIDTSNAPGASVTVNTGDTAQPAGTTERVQPAAVVEADVCAVLLGENIIDADGDVVVDASQLPLLIARLILLGELDPGNIASVNALVALIIDGGCTTAADAADADAVDSDAADTDTADSDAADADTSDADGTDAADTTDGMEPPVIDAQICAVLLGENIIDVNGNLVVDASTLVATLGALVTSGELVLGDIADVDALIALLVDGGCATAADAADADAVDADTTDADTADADTADADAADTDAADTTDTTDGTESPVIDLDVCAVLLVNELIDFDGNLAVDASTLPAILGNLITSGQLDLGDIASVDALIALLVDGGCATSGNDAGDADAADADASDADAVDADAVDADAADADSADVDAADTTDTTDGTEPPVIDAQICAVLLGENIIDVDGNLAVDPSTLTAALGALITSGELVLGDIADIDALIALLVDGGCATAADAADADAVDGDTTDADATDADAADAVDADATDADGSDAADTTDGVEPPVIDAQICAVLLGENIIDASGDLIVDASTLPAILSALITSGDLDLGDIADVDALIALLADGGCATADDAADADAVDADAADADAVDADAVDADATDADAADADAADADAADADAADADSADADAADTDAADADSADADATDADAADTDAADVADADSADADAADADATDADGTDAADTADSTDGTDAGNGTVNVAVYACDSLAQAQFEYKNSLDPVAGATGCDPATAGLTFTSKDTGAVYVVTLSASVAFAGSPLFQVAGGSEFTINGTGSVQLPAGNYTVSASDIDATLDITIAEGDENPNLVLSAPAGEPGTTPATDSPGTGGSTTTQVTGLPSTGSGESMSAFVWPLIAAASVLLMLAGHFVLGTVKQRRK